MENTTIILAAIGALSIGVTIGLIVLMFLYIRLKNDYEYKKTLLKSLEKESKGEENKEIKPVKYSMLNDFIEINYTKLNNGSVNYSTKLSDKGLTFLKGHTTIKDLWTFTQGWLEAYQHNVIFYGNAEEQVPFLEALATKHFLTAIIGRAYEISNIPPTKE